MTSPSLQVTPWALAKQFEPCIADGTRVIVAAGNRVLFYNAETGDLLDSLRGFYNLIIA